MLTLLGKKSSSRDPQTVSNDELGKTWRNREAQLLRLLSAKNLDSIKGSFDMLTSDDNPGLSGSQFMATLLRLFGHLIVDREEFAISGLELFNAIDVNGDRSMEWEELLEYVVQTVTASVAAPDTTVSNSGVIGGDSMGRHGENTSLAAFSYAPLAPPPNAAISPETAADRLVGSGGSSSEGGALPCMPQCALWARCRAHPQV